MTAMNNDASNAQDGLGTAPITDENCKSALSPEAPLSTSGLENSRRETIGSYKLIAGSEAELRELGNQLQLQRHLSLRHATRSTELEERLHAAQVEVSRLANAMADLEKVAESYRLRISQIEQSRFYKLLKGYTKLYELPLIGETLIAIRRAIGRLIRAVR